VEAVVLDDNDADNDDDASLLALLRAPPSPQTRAAVVERLMTRRTRARYDLVQQAVEEGCVAPDAPIASMSGQLVHMAAAHGAVGLLRCLIVGKGVDVNVASGTGSRPLHMALLMGKEAAAMFLIEAGGDVHAATQGGVTPMMLAAMQGVLPALRALAARGAAANVKDDKGRSVLQYAIVQQRDEAAAFLVAEAGAAWKLEDTKAQTVLHVGACAGLPQLVRATLRRMRADGLDDAAITAHVEEAGGVSFALRRGVAHLEVLMEEGGLDVARRGQHLLHAACKAGHGEAVDFLLAKGCDPLEHDDAGLLPHHHAAKTGNLPLLQSLVRGAGVSVDAEGVGNAKGTTALLLAALRGNLAMVDWLVGEAGADPVRKGRCDDGVAWRPLQLAEVHGHGAVAAVLRQCEEAREAAAAAACVQEVLAGRRREGGGREGVTAEEVGAAGEGQGQEQGEQGEEQEEAAPPRPPLPLADFVQADVPHYLSCPIWLQLLDDPVLLVGDGHTYSRAAIQRHFAVRRAGGGWRGFVGLLVWVWWWWWCVGGGVVCCVCLLVVVIGLDAHSLLTHTCRALALTIHE
jgi:ankyrin repeat protein